MPETEVLIRGSELRTYRRCRQRWFWSYRKLLEPKRKKGALTFGSIWHIAMEHYYPPGRKRGVNPAKTFEKVFLANKEQFEQWDEEGNQVDALELGLAMANNYVDRYGNDEHIEIVHPEEAFQVDIYDRDGKYLCTFVGKFDALGFNHNTDRYFVFEHKTGKSIENVQLISGYGDQGLGYWFAANHWLEWKGFLQEGQLIDSILFNMARKGLSDDRPQNKQGLYLNKPKKEALMAMCASKGIAVVSPRTVAGATQALLKAGVTEHQIAQLGEPSKKQASPLFARQEIPLDEGAADQFEKRMRRQAVDMRNTPRRLAIYKNPTKDCTWECPFFNACEVHEMGGDYRGILDIDFKRWNPYSDHALEEERLTGG